MKKLTLFILSVSVFAVMNAPAALCAADYPAPPLPPVEQGSESAQDMTDAATNQRGYSRLIQAILDNDESKTSMDRLHALIRQASLEDIQQADGDGLTPLMYACVLLQEKVVADLLAKFPDQETKSAYINKKIYAPRDKTIHGKTALDLLNALSVDGLSQGELRAVRKIRAMLQDGQETHSVYSRFAK